MKFFQYIALALFVTLGSVGAVVLGNLIGAAIRGLR